MTETIKAPGAAGESRRSPAARVDHFTVEERVAQGRAARGEVPRSAHATWEPPRDRPSPVELLQEQARTRVAELVPIRYGRMLVSPFTFYRGAAYLMASDLSGLPRTGLRTQLCGDAHLSNFGAFAAPDRQLVFSINDFDETLPGPFEWDVKRLVTSFEVAGRDRGFDDKQRAAVNETVSRAYRKAMAGFAEAGNLDLWYTRTDVEEMLARAASEGTAKQLKRAAKNVGKARTRVPELVPIRFGRMLVSPFTFYRGGAYLMASDLSGLPRTGLRTQLCGDAHLSNFGAFAAPDRQLVFSINDFDETLPGPFEWDVKRLVTSFEVAGRDRGFDDKQRAAINETVSRAYREAMAAFAESGNLDLWYTRIDVEKMLARAASDGTAKQLKRAAKNVGKARTKDSLKAFAKLTEVVDGEPRIVSDPPAVTPVEEVVGDAAELFEELLRGIVRSYRRTLAGDRRHLLERYRYVHAARKVVGVGSVGTRAWIMLLLGRDAGDPLFLQFKEAETSVLEPFLGESEFANHGQRVVEGQRLIQAASDIMLGWTRTDAVEGVERDFYVRQLWDAKGSALVDVFEPNAMAYYAKVCGTELARAHARAGDAIAIASYLGGNNTFDQAVGVFAESYADQNERDYDALKQAVDTGSIEAETGI